FSNRPSAHLRSLCTVAERRVRPPCRSSATDAGVAFPRARDFPPAIHHASERSDRLAARSRCVTPIAGRLAQSLHCQIVAAVALSACGARGAAGDRPDVGEHAAGVPGWEGSYQRRGAVELNAALAGGLGPGELAGVPFDEGFGFRRDVKVL